MKKLLSNLSLKISNGLQFAFFVIVSLCAFSPAKAQLFKPSQYDVLLNFNDSYVTKNKGKILMVTLLLVGNKFYGVTLSEGSMD